MNAIKTNRLRCLVKNLRTAGNFSSVGASENIQAQRSLVVFAQLPIGEDMVRENPRITQIAQLLRSGKYAEADSLIVQESSRVKTQIADLKRKIVSCASAT